METRGRSSSRRQSASASSTPATAAAAAVAPAPAPARATRASSPRPSSGAAGRASSAARSSSAASAGVTGPLTRSRAARGKRQAPATRASRASSQDAPPVRQSKRARTSRASAQPARESASRSSRRGQGKRSAAGSRGAARSTANSNRSRNEMADPPNPPPPPPPPLPPQGSSANDAASGPLNGDESEEQDVSLQGLLRRLGAGLDDMFPPAGSSQTRLRNILSVLRGPAEEPARLDALTQLCDYLSVGTEESMVSFSIDSFVPPLVALLGEGNSADTMLLAARALTHLMDALPASASSISQNNAAAPLCANLLTIEYIDLAEQSLAALEKLSIDYPQSIVRAGGFAAALSFIDFFSTGVQRVAATTTCNMCRAPPPESLDMIVDVLPSMMLLLNNDDQRIRESMMLGFSRLAESFKTASEKLERLCGGEEAALIERVISLIVPTSPPALAPPSYSAALKLLATLSRGSAKLSANLLATEALVLKLRSLLTANTSLHAMDCLNLADALLPESAMETEDSPLQSAVSATISLARTSRRRRSSSSLAAFASIDSTRRDHIESDPESLAFFGKILLSSLFEFYQSSADASARRTTLSIIAKFLALAPASVLESLIFASEGRFHEGNENDVTSGPRFAPFVAALLGENCSLHESIAGLSLAHFALSKVPDIKTLFSREGVFHEMMRLAAGAAVEEKDPPSSRAPRSSGASGATGSTGADGPGRSSSGNLGSAGPAVPRTRSSASAAAAAAAAAAAVAALADASSRGENASSTVASNPAGESGTGGRSSLPSGISGLPLRLAPLRALHPSPPDVSQATVAEVAKVLVEKHIGSSSDGSWDGDVLASLTAVAKGLRDASASGDPSAGHESLATLADILGDDQGLTTFEVSRSGIVAVLDAFLSAEGHPPALRTQRTINFVQCLNAQASRGAFALLVARVLGSFASEEKLPVCISEAHSSAHGSSSGSVGSGLRQLVQPFKLSLKRASASAGGADLRDYSHHVVLIEPLATMASVQEFLWTRVQSQGAHSDGEEPFPDGHRHGSGRSSGQDEVNDLVLDEDDEHVDDDDDDDVPMDHDGSGDGDVDDDNEEDRHDGVFAMEEDENDEDEMRRSDDDFSSGSDDVIGEGNGEEHAHDHDEMDEDGGFAGPMPGSLPAVELDHDTLSQSPKDADGKGPAAAQGATHSPGAGPSSTGGSGRSAGEAPGLASSSRNRRSDLPAGPRSYAAALASGTEHSRDDKSGGDQSARRRGVRPSGNPIQKLTFTLNGQVVPHDYSILHAVLQSRSDGLAVGPRLWSEVYTLTYARASPSGSSSGGAGDTRAGSSNPGAAAGPSRSGNTPGGLSRSRPTRRSRRLSGRSASADLSALAAEAAGPGSSSRAGAGPAEGVSPAADKLAPDTSSTDNRPECTGKQLEQGSQPVPELTAPEVLYRSSAFVPSLSTHGDLPKSVQEVIQLLRRLDWIFRVLGASSGSGEDFAGNSAGDRAVALDPVEGVNFASQKITAKLHRQLSDPLALCGGAIPKWCYTLARDASFLVPFETRQVLFQSTALGVARALNLLQQRSDASSVGSEAPRHGMVHRTQAMRDTEARISRIQRQKVRIHRSRVLESAMRVMTLYASHGTVLEVEYFDEVGTGLGPTLEFYTMVSRELQRLDLGLWRGQESQKRQEEKEAVGNGRANVGAGDAIANSSSAKAPRKPSTPRRTSKAPASCSPSSREFASGEVEYVTPTGSGLTPSCIPMSDTGNVEFAQRLSYFPFIGRLIAKALSDGRLLDLRFSPVFAKLLLSFCSIMVEREARGRTEGDALGEGRQGNSPDSGGADIGKAAALSKELESISDAELWREFAEGTPGLVLLRDVDPQLALSLQNVLDIANGKHSASVSDLCLSFVLPENEQIELCPGGKDVDVTANNAVEYVAAVARFVLCSGVRRQGEALLRGFSDVLDLKSLLLFQANELELLFCGPAFETWSTEFLVQATKCDHGYRHESDAVVYLFRVLSELDSEDQRRFVMFATGSPALPVGGLMSLRPRLTIVKRTPEGGRSPDECLPTVMTCTNYFKLPDYSSYEVTKARLLYAMREGQGSFHLS